MEESNQKSVKNSTKQQLLYEINQVRSEVADDLQNIFLSEIKETPFKTIAQQVACAQKEVDQVFEAYHEDIKRGVELYIKYATPNEQLDLGKFFGKSFSYLEGDPTRINGYNEKDFALLDTIGTRVFLDNQFKEASCMWRLIIQCDPTYSRAWVGWALSEINLQNIDVAKQIYAMALQILPTDALIAFFAAEFYIGRNEREVAREILQTAIKNITESNENNPAAIDTLQTQLGTL